MFNQTQAFQIDQPNLSADEHLREVSFTQDLLLLMEKYGKSTDAEQLEVANRLLDIVAVNQKVTSTMFERILKAQKQLKKALSFA